MVKLKKDELFMSDEVWKLWLEKARSSLAKAALGRQTPDILYEDLCFDAQQSVE